MSAWSTRFFVKRLGGAIAAGQDVLTKDAGPEYEKAAGEVAEEWSRRIASSGRGGSNNGLMADINHKVTQPKSGGYFVRIGWFDPAGLPAKDGKTSWFVYQDVGYRAFGNRAFVPGLLIQQDMRQKLEVKMLQANTRIASKVKSRIRRSR